MLTRVGARIPDLGKWSVQGVAGGLTVIWGQPGSMKSFFAMSIAVAVASGKPWFGRHVNKGPVIYVVGEGGLGNVEMRLQMAARAIGVGMGSDFDLYLSQKLDLSGKHNLSETWQEWDEIQPKLVVVDTVSRCLPGDENKQEVMQGFISVLDSIRERFNSSVIAVHHGSKDHYVGKVKVSGTIRGSTALPAAADVVLYLEKKDGPKCIKIVAEKLKDLDTDDFEPGLLYPEVVDAVEPSGLILSDQFGDKVTTLVLREPAEIAQHEMEVFVAFTQLALSRSKDKCVGFREWFNASGKSKAMFKRAIMGLMSKGDVREAETGHYLDGSNTNEFYEAGDNHDADIDQRQIREIAQWKEDSAAEKRQAEMEERAAEAAEYAKLGIPVDDDRWNWEDEEE